MSRQCFISISPENIKNQRYSNVSVGIEMKYLHEMVQKHYSPSICDVLRNLLPFLQFKKRLL